MPNVTKRKFGNDYQIKDSYFLYELPIWQNRKRMILSKNLISLKIFALFANSFCVFVFGLFECFEKKREILYKGDCKCEM